MKISASNDYALRMCCYLARKGSVAASSEMSAATGVSRGYLTQLAQCLRAAGIIEARYGKHGGYLLAVSPRDVTALEIVTAVGGSIDGGGACREAVCVARKAAQALGAVTLEEILEEGSRGGDDDGGR